MLLNLYLQVPRGHTIMFYIGVKAECFTWNSVSEGSDAFLAKYHTKLRKNVNILFLTLNLAPQLVWHDRDLFVWCILLGFAWFLALLHSAVTGWMLPVWQVPRIEDWGSNVVDYIYMFTKCLLDYIHCYLQYLPIEVVLLSITCCTLLL